MDASTEKAEVSTPGSGSWPSQPLPDTPPSEDVSVPKAQGLVIPDLPQRHRLRLILLIIVVLTLVVVSGIGVAFTIQYYFNNPWRVLSQAFSSFREAQSWVGSVQLSQRVDVGQATATLTYHKGPIRFSHVEVSLPDEAGEQTAIALVFNQSNLFLRLQYSKFSELEAVLRQSNSELFSLPTYQQLRPVFMGERWLHVVLPEPVQKEVWGDDWQSGISAEQKELLQQRFSESLVVRTFDQRYEREGRRYYRIIFGFDKRRFAHFVESLKTLDLGIEVAKFNRLIKVIESVENWDRDLVVILVEKSSMTISSVSISLPVVPETVWKDEDGKQAEEDGEGIPSLPQFFSDILFRSLETKELGNLERIGTVEFSDYNLVPLVEPPTEVVEYDAVAGSIEKELVPLMQLFFGSSVSPLEEPTPESPTSAEGPLPG